MPGEPRVEKMVLHLPESKTLTLEAKNLLAANKYVASITFNGQLLTGAFIHHNDIMNGEHTVFTMTELIND